MSRAVTDLRLVVALALGAALALLLPAVPGAAEWALGLPLLLVLPGYAAVAALFPQRPRPDSGPTGSPSWAARIGLALVGSVLTVAVVGVVLATGPGPGLTLVPVVLILAALALVGVAVAATRRNGLPVERRADPLASASVGAVTGAFGTSGTQSLALLVTALALVSALAVAGTGPAAQPYSELYLTGGEDVDVGLENATLAAGAQNTMGLALENHEGHETAYRVVVHVERVAEDGSVAERERLDAFTATLGANETRVFERALSPSVTGERLRLTVEATTHVDSPVAERDSLTLRRWVTVVDGSAP